MIYILTCFVKLNMTILYTPLQKTPSPAQILARELPQGSIPSRYMLHACPRLPRICESIAGTAPMECLVSCDTAIRHSPFAIRY
jgi:hypothetical protein